MKNKFSTFFLLLCSSFVGFSQQTTNNHTVVKGETVTQIAKKYQTTTNEIFLLNPQAVNGINENQVLLVPNVDYLGLQHEVQTKETVYGISKKYNIAIDQLYLYNPDLKENGLKVGQKINISKPKSNLKTASNSSIPFKEVLVQDKETIYSIAVENNTTVSAIYDLNPGLETNGLKKGQFLKIPNTTSLSNSKANNQITVQPKETIYGISKKYNVSQIDLITWNPQLKDGLREGMVLNIQQINDVNKSNLKPVENFFSEEQKTSSQKNIQQNNNLELTLLLPFNINEDTFSDRTNLNKRLKSDVFFNMALDFYSGALIAVDSAKTLNLPIHIKIVDSKENNRSLNIETLRKEIDFTNTDVVIGPFFQKNVDAFSEIFKDQDLMVVSPLSTDVGKPYPNQVHAMPNNRLIRNTMMEYLRSNSGNIVAVVNPKNNTNKNYFSKDFADVKVVNTADNGSVNISNIEANLSSNQVNYVILDSDAIRSAVDLITGLKKLRTKYNIRLVTLEKMDVLDSTEVKIQDLVDLKFTFPSVTNETTDNFNSNFDSAFKKRFNTTPNRFALRGFDVTMDVILRMVQNDNESNAIFGYGSEQIENRFTYVNENGGIFNSGIYVLYYDKDLTIKEAQ